MQALSQADILLCEDTRVTKKLLHILQERHNVTCNDNQEFISVHSHNEHAFLEKIEPSFFDKNVVYASDAGMPGISDPGQLLVNYCIEHDLTYDILPGANALLTAFVASGFVGTKMLFLGFLDHKGTSREAGLQEALFNGYTTILYESPHRLVKLLQEIEKVDSFREIFLAKELTKKYQSFFRGTAKDVSVQLNGNTKGEWVVVIKAAPKQNASAISQNDILALDIPKKMQAKLISKITGENTKECYNRLMSLY
jgi:16S rRNA (cytidine1402-2'-O)-methyltransferase